MAKDKSQKDSKVKKTSKKEEKSTKTLSFLLDQKAVDPTLASLFSSSLGPVQALPKSRYSAPAKPATKQAPIETENDEELSELESQDESSEAEEEDDDDDEEEGVELDEAAWEDEVGNGAASESESEEAQPMRLDDLFDQKADKDTTSRKRKRKDNDDVENAYLHKLAQEEQREDDKRRQEKKPKRTATEPVDSNMPDADADAEQDDNDDAIGDEGPDEDFHKPTHISLLPPVTEPTELEKATRTVFLGNISTSAILSKSAKKTLLAHLTSFIPSLPPSNPPHRIESIRFRSTAFSSSKPKKAAFARKEIMDATTKSTNAYAVYSTWKAAAEAAARLNGTIVLGRHMRVDHLSHPAKIDHRRCVFVGNLGFVDDTSAVAAASSDDPMRKKKSKPPADVEEGLWKHLTPAGRIESVRVVRDARTRVGKGFAYVQFVEQNGVEAALLLNGKTFPPLLPRPLRIMRAKSIKRNPGKDAAHPTTRDSGAGTKGAGAGGKVSDGIYSRKFTPAEKSAIGRTSKLLGRAGTAAARRGKLPGAAGEIVGPERFVFEGHRASASQGKQGFKFKTGKKKAGGGKGKPKTRSSQRGAAWKAKGAKKD